MDNEEILVDDNIRPYLNEIAERLWSTPSHAAIMVGAGFSKNSNQKFPDWATLGDLFFEKLHGKKPDIGSGEERYLNPLKLADEVQAAFGRPALDQLLRSNIPDTDSTPSPLHIKLLELPWSDVFTTNYDTLLDRARDSISSQKFDLVINKEDLIYSEKPRIIKLHGSFPSERPFIITEEDYRTYPKIFAPFVNTVQQSLLENILCLIGFSGDDPNFLQWIGWIRDNLGKQNAPKIYLIGIINLSEAQKKLLEQRNIVLIDFSTSQDINENHYDALERFFDYLLSRKKEKNRLGWPENLTKTSPETDKDKIVQMNDIVLTWKQIRLDYPNWIVVPEDRRRSLWTYTNHWTRYILSNDEWEAPLDLSFIFELNWRLERCLMPILNYLEEAYIKILHKYWPFSITCSEDITICFSNQNYKNLNWTEIQYMWLELSLSLLRYYREEGMFEKWEVLSKKLNNLIDFFSQEQISFFYYERVLYALFKLDIPKVKSELNVWPSNFSIPHWEAKRAGLLAEIGENNKAERILERSLHEVRSKLNLKPVTIDYSLVSEEASIMLLIQYIKQSLAFENSSWEEEKENRRQLSKRWDTLRQYKCDPWGEITKFEDKLDKAPIEQAEITTKLEFDIGHITRTHHMKNMDTEGIVAYNFLRYFEELGLSFRIKGSSIGTTSAAGAIQRLSKYSSHWAVVTLIRIGDRKVTDHLFDRQSLVGFKVHDIDTMIDDYLNILKQVEPHIADSNSIKVDNFGVRLASIIPEILSRLSSKCSKEKKLLLFDFICATYASKYKNKFKGIDKLFSRLMKTFSMQEQYMLIPKFLEIPYPIGTNIITERDYQNPFNYINMNKEKIDFSIKADINSKSIDRLFKFASSRDQNEREWAILSLINIFEFNLLTDSQAEKLGTILWSQTDDVGFPSATGYYKFAFLNFPHPNDIDVHKLIQSYIMDSDFPIQANKEGKGISITHGDISLSYEISGASLYINWSQDEIENLLNKLNKWWMLDKVYLSDSSTNSPFASIPEEFHSRFLRLINNLNAILANVRNNFISDNQKVIIRHLIKELDENKFHTLLLKVNAFSLLELSENEMFIMIKNALYSNDDKEVIDALNAILSLLKNNLFTDQNLLNELLITIGQKIAWRHPIALVSFLNTIFNIIEDYSQYWNDVLEGLCLQGINLLVNETELDQKMSKIDFSLKLEVREATAKLAIQLIKFYKEQKLAIPEEVLVWEKICTNENEFAEIKILCSN